MRCEQKCLHLECPQFKKMVPISSDFSCIIIIIIIIIFIVVLMLHIRCDNKRHCCRSYSALKGIGKYHIVRLSSRNIGLNISEYLQKNLSNNKYQNKISNIILPNSMLRVVISNVNYVHF
jgi:hypothetical protein